MVCDSIKPVRLGLLLFAFGSALGLVGCGTEVSPVDQPLALPGTMISGHVHGGVFPIQNATVRLMETQTSGYGGPAKQLAMTTSDSSGYFTIPYTPAAGNRAASWSCDSNQFAYITVTGGHTATNTANYNVAQVGVIGSCSQFLSSSSEINNVQVFVSELSTIAAAYTLRSFITIDNTNAGSGEQIINISAPANNNASSGVCTFTAPTSCVAAGLAHGFQNAYNLVDSVNYQNQLPTGQARLTPPANPNGFAPQALVNTLGNILQSCVDSPGGAVGTYSSYMAGGTGSTPCGDLFYWATPPGGAPPTNTLQAAMNMAQYPANNATNLYNLQPRAVFFTPDLSQAPHDLSVSMFYLTSGFGGASGGLTKPVALALDSNDDAFILAGSGIGSNNTETAVLGMAANGAVLFAGPVTTTYLNPSSIAVDALDNIWVTNDSATSGAVLKVSASTGAISVGTTLASAAGLAVDKFNDVWVSTDSTTANSIQEFGNSSLSGTATPIAQSNALGASLLSLAIDGAGDLWALNAGSTTSSAVVFANTGTSAKPAYANNLSQATLAGAAGYGAAANSAQSVYLPLNNQIDNAQYSSGALTANTAGTFTGAAQDSSSYNAPNQSEVDGAGNLFFADLESTGRIFQFVPSTPGSMYQGSLYSILPCYPDNGVCYAPAVLDGRAMQVDSAGTLWYLADASYYGYPIGVVIQTFGVGTATWPQMSLQQPGVKPQ